MLKSTAFAAALSLAAGSAAFADTYTAQLQAPVAKLTKVVAGGAVWSCEGATCVTSSDVDRVFTVSGCKELGREVGAVASYGGVKSLEAGQLARCNAGFKPALTQTAQAGGAATR